MRAAVLTLQGAGSRPKYRRHVHTEWTWAIPRLMVSIIQVFVAYRCDGNTLAHQGLTYCTWS
jgi:hypothetical protein